MPLTFEDIAYLRDRAAHPITDEGCVHVKIAPDWLIELLDAAEEGLHHRLAAGTYVPENHPAGSSLTAEQAAAILASAFRVSRAT